MGLAIARALLLLQKAGSSSGFGPAFGRVTVLEASHSLGAGASGRNSGVVHGGIYYRPGSLKARLSVRGRDLLYDYARAASLPFSACGKLVVATGSAELARLESLRSNGADCGVPLALLSGRECRRLEPALSACVEGGLVSDKSGIVDVPALLRSLRGDVEADPRGRMLMGTRYVGMGGASSGGDELGGGCCGGGGAVVVRARAGSGGSSELLIGADAVVNAAGLHAQALAEEAGEEPAPLVLARGVYFRLPPGVEAPFKRRAVSVRAREWRGVGSVRGRPFLFPRLSG